MGLYDDAWTDPEIRWLMSTVPTAMIFDDHDVRDDWNTSAAWRDEMRAKPWWRDPDPLGAGVVLGVPAPRQPLPRRAGRRSRLTARCVEHDGDAWPLLVELADRADAETDGAKGVRFSFRWDVGRTRLLMIDSRNGRILDDGQHLMLGDREFAWIEEQAAAPGAVDHLRARHLGAVAAAARDRRPETVNEIAAAKPGRRGRLAEKIRQAADLEHWAAFRESFDRLTAMIARAAGSGAATVSVLSGDVHHSYAARADSCRRRCAARSTSSPARRCTTRSSWYVRPGSGSRWSARRRRLAERLGAAVWAPRPSRSRGSELAGPFFGNTIATLDLGRTAAPSGALRATRHRRPRSSAPAST